MAETLSFIEPVVQNCLLLTYQNYRHHVLIITYMNAGQVVIRRGMLR